MKKIIRLTIAVLGILNVLTVRPAYAKADDGTYDARVHTYGGNYRLDVDVENGEVMSVHWPNGDDLKLHGGELSGGEANAQDTDGNHISIEIDDSYYHEQ